MSKRLTRLFEFVLIALFLASCSSSKPSEGLGVYPKAVGAADEASAIQALRTIATAEAQLKAATGAYGNFEELVQAGFLDNRFAGATPTVPCIGSSGSSTLWSPRRAWYRTVRRSRSTS